MKNKLFIYAILSITLSGCLDLNPISEINEETFFANDQEMEVGVIACYNGLMEPIKTEWMLTDIRSDVSRAYDKSSSKTEVKNIMALNELEAFASIQEIESYWNAVYNNIYRCNMVLKNIGNVSNEEKRKQYEGEATFIRAYHYFNLVRLFGPTFLVTEPISAQEAYSFGRTAVEGVYAFIENDLKKIIDENLLPESYDKTDLGRVTILSARTLLGKVYLTQKKYQEAKEQLKAVEDAYGNYDLSSIPYADVFSTNNEMNKEIIFAIRFKSGKVGLGNPFGNMFAPLNSGTSVINGNGESLNYPSTKLVESYKNGDQRKDVTLGFGYVNNQTNNYVNIRYVKKYLSPVTTAEDGENDVPVLRYADVLLMLAEIENELNDSPTSTAFNYLNATVVRAGLPPFTATDLNNKVKFRLAVEEERYKEFAYENQRFFDLIRTDRYTTVMKQYYQSEYDEKNDELYYQDNNNLINGVINENQLLLPLPTSLIDVNPNITQNPGY